MEQIIREYRLSSGSKALLFIQVGLFIGFGVVLIIKCRLYVSGSIISIMTIIWHSILLGTKIVIEDKTVVFKSIISRLPINIIRIKQIYLFKDFENTIIYIMKYFDDNGRESKKYFLKPEYIDLLFESIKNENSAIIFNDNY